MENVILHWVHYAVPRIKSFSINLSEVLINDYLILKEFKILDDEHIQVIENKNDKIDLNKKLFLIPASLKKFLLNIDIDLFVNIASFQEMNIGEIKTTWISLNKKKHSSTVVIENTKNYMVKRSYILINILGETV